MTTEKRHHAAIGLLVTLFIALAPLQFGQTARVAEENDDRPVGTIAWVIHEVATGKVVDEGRSAVRLKDISLQELPPATNVPAQFKLPAPGRHVTKTLRLNDQFTLEMAEYPVANKADKRGFGFVPRRVGVSTFSWEWFVIKTELRAEKLQEGGELGIDLKQVGSDWEVTRTEFLTDVAFRVARMGVDSPGNSTWRVSILKGSTINWPSLLNGRVVAN